MQETELTAKEFSTQTGISYPVVIRWLKEGKIPARQTTFNVWQIPSSEVAKFTTLERKPKRGRPRRNEKGE